MSKETTPTVLPTTHVNAPMPLVNPPKNADRDEDLDDRLTVACFLLYSDPDEVCGGPTGKDALDAFARLMQVPVARLMRLKDG